MLRKIWIYLFIGTMMSTLGVAQTLVPPSRIQWSQFTGNGAPSTTCQGTTPAPNAADAALGWSYLDNTTGNTWACLYNGSTYAWRQTSAGAVTGTVDIVQNPLVEELPNNTANGAVLYHLVCVSTSGTAQPCTTTSTQWTGVAVGGSLGTSAGNVKLARTGQVALIMDGTTTIGDYVQISTTTNGDGHDTGSNVYPTSGAILGRIVTNNSGTGTTAVVNLYSPGISGAGISGLTAGYLPLAGSSTTLSSNSPLEYGLTTLGVLTSHASFQTCCGPGTLTIGASGTQGTIYLGNGTSGLAAIQVATGALGSQTHTFPNNTGGTIIEHNLVSGDCTITSSGVITCTKTNNTAFTGYATATYVADTTITIGASVLFAANTCSSATGVANTLSTISMPNLTTTMTVQFTHQGDIHAITGWSPSTGLLYIDPEPSAAGTASYYVCNNTSASITTGAATTWNVSAR